LHKLKFEEIKFRRCTYLLSSGCVRLLLATVGLVFFLYLLLCTYLWNVVYGLFLVIVTNDAPAHVVATSQWCKPGDWVLQTFQPMVSDQRMMKHYARHKEEMNRYAEMFVKQQNISKKDQEQDLEMQQRAEVTGSMSSGGPWSQNPYSVDEAIASRLCWSRLSHSSTQEERLACWRNDVALGRGLTVVNVTPSFGKTHAQYFCSVGRNSFKGYKYFPGGIPRVEAGHVMLRVEYSDRYKAYVSDRDSEVIESTDSDPGGYKTVLRQIDDRWFIYRN
jgi:hypothetical protein